MSCLSQLACLAVTLLQGSMLLAQAGFVELPRLALPLDSSTTQQIIVADVNRDGIQDLVYANFGGPNRLFLGDGRGNFMDATATHLPSSYGTSNMCSGAVAVDVDKDGDLDLVFASSHPLLLQDQLYLNDGTGHFTNATVTHLPVDANEDTAVVSADFNGDGWPDLAFCRIRTVTNFGRNHILLNDRTGRFVDTLQPFSFEGPSLFSLAVGDIDGDGDLDLIAAFQTLVYVFVNDGTGHFSDVSLSALPPFLGYPRRVALFDMDGDGDLDIVTGGGVVRAITVLANDGHGRFTDVTTSSVFCNYTAIPFGSIVAVDIDGNGDLDILVAPGDLGTNPSTCIANFTLMLNDGTGKFYMQSVAVGGRAEGGYAIACGDLDGDGDVDVVVGNEQSSGASDRMFFNLARQAYAPVYPHIGKGYSIAVSGLLGQTMGQAFLSPQSARIVIPLVGQLGLDPMSIIALPASTLSGGFASWSLTIPNDFNLVGARFYSQALVWNPSIPQTHLLTNAIVETIVP